MDDADLRLDGNAAAGLLSEVFPFEMTVAWTRCAGCGGEGQVGELHLYMRAPGAVFRCARCDAVQMRIVRAPGRLYLDLTGVRRLEIRTG